MRIHIWNTIKCEKLHFHTVWQLSLVLCTRSLASVLFFTHLSPFFPYTHNLCRVKYVWKKRYSFLFFKFYCTKNVDSENAMTSNVKHIQDTYKSAPAPCVPNNKKCDVTYYYLYLKYTTETIFSNGIFWMIKRDYTKQTHCYCCCFDCNLPLLVQSFFFYQHCCFDCVYIVRWWIINVNYRFSVVMLMRRLISSINTMNAPCGINSINSI